MTAILATGAAMTTAVTDLITGIAALFLTIRLCRIRGDCSVLKKYWILFFSLLGGASVLGFIAHAFLWTRTVYNIIWIFLYAVLFETAAVFLILSICSFYGTGRITKRLKLTVYSLTAALYFITAALPFFGINGIRIFVIYGMLLALPGFALFAADAVKNKDRGAMIFLLAFIPQIIGAVYQIMRKGEFRLIFVFDYNSIYHICLFVSVFIFFFSAKISISAKGAANKADGCTGDH